VTEEIHGNISICPAEEVNIGLMNTNCNEIYTLRSWSMDMVKSDFIVAFVYPQGPSTK